MGVRGGLRSLWRAFFISRRIYYIIVKKDNKDPLQQPGTRGNAGMEPNLRTALLTTITDYNAIGKELHDPNTAPARGVQLLAAKEAVNQVLQHFANAEYIECVNDQWRIKVIVVESVHVNKEGS